MLVTLTVATEALIVTAIMPAIVRDIGGLSLYGLAFSAFFLAGLSSIPTAGWAVDRYGPARPFAMLIVVFLAGSVVAALAPSMPVLIVGRVLQGYGATAQFTLTQSTIARAYAGRARVSVLSMMSATWTIPALIGPSLGALIAGAFGWRWAFAVIIAPALAAGALTYPRLRRLPPTAASTAPFPVRWPLQVAAGTGVILTGLTAGTWWGIVLVAAGLPVTYFALRRTLPRGSFLARPGLPAIVAAGFLLNIAFYGAASFVPLLLTRIRGTSITEAGIAVTAGTVAWTAGVWLNTQLVNRYRRDRLVAASAALLAVGIGGFATTMYGAPLPAAYVAWLLAGAGMGIAFNVFTLNTMALAASGGEGAALASRNLSANLGTAVGTGVGGAAIALSESLRLGLRPGLAFVYAAAAFCAVGAAMLAGRSTVRGG
ncbi:MAG: MFS transporter [Candidatus Dormibacteraeota bacterium]|nr:MFS transporter [Candidatus Dormibacteraeota bacterium]